MDLINARENYKDLPNGKTALRVFSGGVFAGVEYDDIQVTYPNDTTEVYSAFFSAVLQRTVTVTYQDDTKEKLIRAQVTYAL